MKKTTAEQAKNNYCRVGQLGSWILTHYEYLAAQNNSRMLKKQLPRQQKPTTEAAKNNCRNIKKQLPG